MDNLTEKDLEKMLKEKKKEAKKRRRMKSGKRALFLAFGICAELILFTQFMIYLGKDTTSLTILATAGVGILPVMYGIYDHNETKINLMHMEKNYISDYDNKEGIY